MNKGKKYNSKTDSYNKESINIKTVLKAKNN